MLHYPQNFSTIYGSPIRTFLTARCQVWKIFLVLNALRCSYLFIFLLFFFLLQKLRYWLTNSPASHCTGTKQWGMQPECMQSLRAKWNFNCIRWTFKSVPCSSKVVSIFFLRMRDCILFINYFFLPFSVSYNNQKLKLKWSDERVRVNPELKLLQYFMNHKLKLEEKDSLTNERVGKRKLRDKKPWN